MISVKKCHKCGAEFSDGLKCPECGEYVDLLSDDNTEPCPHCGARVMKGFMFCGSCNKRIKPEDEIDIPEKFDFAILGDYTYEPDEPQEEAEETVVEVLEVEVKKEVVDEIQSEDGELPAEDEEPVSVEETVEAEAEDASSKVDDQEIPKEDIEESKKQIEEDNGETIQQKVADAVNDIENEYEMLDEDLDKEAVPEQPEEAGPRFCTVCGNHLEPGQKFCTKCGNKI